MENEFEQSREDIKNIYHDLRKLGHIEDRIKKQTESLKRHLKEKQELRRELKKWKKNKEGI